MEKKKKKKIPSCSVVIKTSQAPGLMSFYQGINESLIRKESWDSRPDVPRNECCSGITESVEFLLDKIPQELNLN